MNSPEEHIFELTGEDFQTELYSGIISFFINLQLLKKIQKYLYYLGFEFQWFVLHKINLFQIIAIIQ